MGGGDKDSKSSWNSSFIQPSSLLRPDPEPFLRNSWRSGHLECHSGSSWESLPWLQKSSPAWALATWGLLCSCALLPLWLLLPSLPGTGPEWMALSLPAPIPYSLSSWLFIQTYQGLVEKSNCRISLSTGSGAYPHLFLALSPCLQPFLSSSWPQVPSMGHAYLLIFGPSH